MDYPVAFSANTGFYYYRRDGSRVHFVNAVPIGRVLHDKTHTSYLVQGKPIHNGHEVAHCKMAGGIGKYKPVLAFNCIWNGSDYYCGSGDYTDQDGRQASRYLITPIFSVTFTATSSNSQAFLSWSFNYHGQFRPKTTTGTVYDNWACQAWIYRNAKPDFRLSGLVKSDVRSELENIISGFMWGSIDPTWKTPSDVYSYNMKRIERVQDFLIKFYERYAIPRQINSSVITGLDYIPFSAEFVLDEPYTLLGDAMITLPYGAYHLKALRQQAYLAALDSVPIMSDNNISNIIEIVGIIKSLVVDHKIEVPRKISDAWLSYRYVYKTTKADVTETLDYVRRMSHDLSKGFSCYGSATGKISADVTATVRCGLQVHDKQLNYLEKLCYNLYKYGLAPSAYAIWDMVPYSFIVDWFLPIGDILHAEDRNRVYNRVYDITDLWYSLTYDHQAENGCNLHCYTRWGESDTPDLNGFYTYEAMGASGKVVGMRILDAMSLTFKF